MDPRKTYRMAALTNPDRARASALQVKYGDEVMNILYAQKLPSSIV